MSRSSLGYFLNKFAVRLLKRVDFEVMARHGYANYMNIKNAKKIYEVMVDKFYTMLYLHYTKILHFSTIVMIVKQNL